MKDITPAHLSQIRQYNRAVKSYENTVTNTGANALVCDQVNYKGIQYSVRCKSTFLRESKNEGVYFKTNAINNNFKLWTESGYCPNGNCLSIDNGIGPSWK